MLYCKTHMALDTETLQKLAGVMLNDANGDAGLAEGTNAGTIKTASAVTPILKGVALSEVAATDNIDPTPVSGNDTIPDDMKAALAVLVNSSGAVKTLLGRCVGLTDQAFMPDYDPETYVCIGHVLVKNETGSDFVVGTTDMGAANVTDTYTDVRRCFPGQEVG